MKISITVENRSTMPIGVGNLQIQVEGQPTIGLNTFGFRDTGFRRGFGFCYLFENNEMVEVGETLQIEVKTFTENAFVLVNCQNRGLGTAL